MLRLLFHRESPVVRILNPIGFLLGAASLGILYLRPVGTGVGNWLHNLALLQFCFIQGCVYFPWYRNLSNKSHDRYLGIGLHFWKVRVAVAYIAPLHILFYLLLGSVWIPLIANILYGVISTSNLLLIYLHYTDSHREPPNLYSTGRYH